MPYPKKFGLPCWNRDQVSRAISITAQTSRESASYFLASHSPFRQITDRKSAGRKVDEEQVFRDVFSSSHAQVQAFVSGEPGTGKSHLIRWLFERCRYDVREDESAADRQRIVLVTRGNGSLKDALGQIVHQLGSEFEKHIHRVQGAIERITGETARATLLAELALEIDTKWTHEHGRSALPSSIRRLGEALRSNGFGRWMTRKGSVVDQVIQRLTDGGTIQERETFPAFSADDFDVPSTAFRLQEVSQQVYEFIEDLKEEPETRELVAKTLNTALSDAIRSLTGLRGSDLLDIFTGIRRQLGPNRKLLILVEDVSVTGLDQDVINAFEPRDGAGLCQMIAVLGITTTAWDGMPDNQRQRATHRFEVGGDTAKTWAGDKDEVARFTARYLNTIRSETDEINSIAADRFAGDISKSRCDACTCKTECFSAFGYADFGNDVTVGMFPFNVGAPQAMLENLTDLWYKSQRGLLDRVLMPALDQSFQSLVQQEFPDPAFFAVQPKPIPFWNAGFLPRYCNGAGWSDVVKNRLRFLAQIWFDEPSADALAKALDPLLGPLGFPRFSSNLIDLPSEPGPKNVPQPGKSEPRREPQQEIVDGELTRLLALLDNWYGGSPLKEDSKFRELLGRLLSNSINWQDFRGVPISEKKRLVTGNTVPRIEAQTANPSSKYEIEFSRDSETYGLLQALLVLSRSPSKTWNVPHGEAHKRSVSRWLRKHQARVVASVNPDDPKIVQGCLRASVQALALIAFFRDRRNLPQDRVERISSLFEPIWTPSDRPVVITETLQRLLEDLEAKQSKLSDFVIQEVGAGQGIADPKDFINPVPLLEILNDLSKDFRLHVPHDEAGDSYWQSRFVTVCQLGRGAFQSIHGGLAKEREAIAEVIGSIDSFIDEAGFKGEDPRESFVQCLEEFKNLIDLQQGPPRKKGILEFPDDQFDKIWQQNLFQDGNVRKVWATAYKDGKRISLSKSDLDVLVFNPQKLKQCGEALISSKRHLEAIEKHLEDEMEHGGTGDESRANLLEVLEEIANLAEKDVKDNPIA